MLLTSTEKLLIFRLFNEAVVTGTLDCYVITKEAIGFLSVICCVSLPYYDVNVSDLLPFLILETR
jgi:hypothetical protein